MKAGHGRLIAAIIACVLSASTPAQEAAQARQYSVPGHGSVVLNIPGGWRVQNRTLSDPPSAFLRIAPASGDAFNIQVTATWIDPAKGDRRPETIKDRVQAAAKAALKQAVETEASVLELRGAQALGYYYSLTDRAPSGPDDYKYMTQGVAIAGELGVIFTILQRAPDPGDKEKALRMVADAAQSKAEVPASASTPDSSEKLKIVERDKVFELSVPISRLVMTLPKAGFTQVPMGTHPRYFQFAGSVIVSGWFEPARGFKGIQEFWKGESEGMKRQGLPTPANVEFTKVGNWEVVVYDMPTKVATFPNLRANWVQAGTWIDIHMSVPKPGPDGRAKMLEILRLIEVREKN